MTGGGQGARSGRSRGGKDDPGRKGQERHHAARAPHAVLNEGRQRSPRTRQAPPPTP